MNWILEPPTPPDRARLGGKAAALADLENAGFPVPRWFVVLPDAFEASLNPETLQRLRQTTDPAAAQRLLETLQPSPDIMLEVHLSVVRLCPAHEPMAVRSSAVAEDALGHSFAGQLESYLFVSRDQVAAKITAVWRSAFAQRVWAYRREHGLSAMPEAPAVLIQRMIPADTAGVAFSADPVSGRRGVAVVSAVLGLGTALVSGETDADTFHVTRDGRITQRSLARKRVMHQPATDQAEGVRAVPIDPARAEIPALSDTQVGAVAELARRAEAHFGLPQDIEWAIAQNEIHLLQSRPITHLEAQPDPDGEWRLWDNANIAESYGGITTPLTYSFARHAYEGVYREFCALMGVSRATIDHHTDTFRCMIGLIRGRVYYNLVNWYRVLAMLPGYTVNRRFMEQMMGVKEGLPREIDPDRPAPTRMAKLRDLLRLSRTVAGLVWNHLTLPRQIHAFYERLNRTLATPDPPLTARRPDELAAYYRSLERQLLTRWDAPLVNDFFAMIFHGALRRLCEKWCASPEGALANDLIRDQGDLLSAEPARRLRELAALVKIHPDLLNQLTQGSLESVHNAVTRVPDFAGRLRDYIDRFGDRCLEELKLESPTLHDDPLLLYRSIAALARRPESPISSPARGEDRTAAERQAAQSPSGRWWRSLLFNWVLRHARHRVRDRENLRFERTRLFGRVRRIFVELGRRLHALGRLEHPRDVFYLEVEEVLGFCDGTTTTTDLKALASLRKVEFADFAKGPPPADRFETFGVVNHAQSFQLTAATRSAAPAAPADPQVRKGLGCCPGSVRGRVRVVRNPREARIEPGEILVAERTDPGWVMLFPAATGLLVEHGSLLSHSAIVSRELGLPGIVSIPGLTSWLQTGDEVEMNGATGEVRRISC